MTFELGSKYSTSVSAEAERGPIKQYLRKRKLIIRQERRKGRKESSPFAKLIDCHGGLRSQDSVDSSNWEG